MNFNYLDFRVTNENDFSVELLVDGNGIEGLEKADDRAIPYWLFERDDLPSFFNEFRKREEHILGVCSCGEAGCGSAGCVLVKDAERVYFKEIFVDGLRFPIDFQFTFSRENYESVMKQIQQMIERFRDTIEQKETL